MGMNGITDIRAHDARNQVVESHLDGNFFDQELDVHRAGSL